MNHSDIAQLFSILANETRIRLLEILKNKALACKNPELCDLTERCCNVTELAEELGIPMSTTSYNIKELHLSGLVDTQRRGQKVYCSISENVIGQVIDFFEALLPQSKLINYIRE